MARYIDADYLIDIISQVNQKESAELKDANLSKKDALMKWAVAYAAWVAVTWLNKTPTADVAPITHAHWESHIGYSICSHCKEKSVAERKYCGSCGAEMDED